MAERLDRVLEHARDPEALIAALCDLDDAVAARMNARLRARGAHVTAGTEVAAPGGGPESETTASGDGGPEGVATNKQGWIRRLVGYMKPHKKNAYIAFGVAIGGQLIQSLLPLVQRVVIDDVITPQTKGQPGDPLAPWLILMIVMGVATFIFAYFRRFRGGRIARRAARPPHGDLRPTAASRLRAPRRARRPGSS